MPRESFSASLVTQGENSFYTLTLPISVLSRTCFIDSRDKNNKDGFQRLLDQKRAEEIAEYIDKRKGVIPTSIILSAQQDSSFEYNSKNKTISFDSSENVFLVIDGQHRVYGFSMAESNLRVPVVVFSNLSKVQEARLFIDINTKQEPVPNELLLEIKNMAKYESENEEYMRFLYDNFYQRNDSFFNGYMTPAKKEKGKLTRVTFNSSINLILSKVIVNSPEKVYDILNSYFYAFSKIMDTNGDKRKILTNPILFKAVISLFTKVSIRVSDRYDSYKVDTFLKVLKPLKDGVTVNTYLKPGKSYKSILKKFEKALDDVSITF